MSNASAMKQISSRNVGFKIELMQWSDKMDLIAISTDKGLFFRITKKNAFFLIHKQNFQVK